MAATAFVAETVRQVVPVVFVDDGNQDFPSVRIPPECKAGLSEMTAGVDRAVLRANQENRREAAQRAYDDEKATVWRRYPDVTRACETDPNGQEALAAFARFERAAAGTAVHKAERLGRVRRHVDSFIR